MLFVPLFPLSMNSCSEKVDIYMYFYKTWHITGTFREETFETYSSTTTLHIHRFTLEKDFRYSTFVHLLMRTHTPKEHCKTTMKIKISP